MHEPSTARDDLATMLANARRRVPYSQAELASFTEVSERSIQGHESGRHLPSPRALRAYARYLGLELELLLRLRDRAERERDGGRSA